MALAMVAEKPRILNRLCRFEKLAQWRKCLGYLALCLTCPAIFRRRKQLDFVFQLFVFHVFHAQSLPQVACNG